MNLSNTFRAVSGLFFCFCFVFGPDTAQAMDTQKVWSFYASLSQEAQKAKNKEVFGILEDLPDIKTKIEPKNLSEEEMRTLVLALDEPTNLIQNSPDGVFGSDLHRVFFFSRFDLHRDSDALFTKLFSIEDRGFDFEQILLLDELPFEETRRNWENFLGAARIAEKSGYARFTETDLEAAAISFIHESLPRYYDWILEDDPIMLLNNPNAWIQQSLGTFFHNRFSIDHYMSPHFTLTPENHYFQYIMAMMGDGFFLFRGQNHPLINSKEFVLKIWKDSIEEIKLLNSISSSSAFLGRIVVESIIECRRQGLSLESHSFLKAMAEAARENERLAKWVDIVNNLVSSRNLESYWRILQDLREISESTQPTDRMISGFLSRTDLQDFVLQHSGRTDPADAGSHL